MNVDVRIEGDLKNGALSNQSDCLYLYPSFMGNVAFKVHKEDPEGPISVSRAIVFEEDVTESPSRVFASPKLFLPVLLYASPIEADFWHTRHSRQNG